MNKMFRDLIEYSKQELEELMFKMGENNFRASQLLHWIHKLNVMDYSKMTNLSKKFRKLLSQKYPFIKAKILQEHHSKDGSIKFLIELPDEEKIETVIMPYEDRTTICISSQVGCALKCSFCQTGKIGFRRNLSATEILWQLKLAKKYVNDKRMNVVFMGMGEPLLNFKEVIKAVKVMISEWGMDLSKRRVTISTAGIVPEIEKLGETKLNINLSVSLNATTNELRNKLMPINKKYPLEMLMEACRNFPLKKGRRITFEYVLIKGLNDSVEDAKRLVKLLRGIKAKVNLIPFNPIFDASYNRPHEEALIEFQKILFDHNISAFIRESRGVDIEAACGQLYAKYSLNKFSH